MEKKIFEVKYSISMGNEKEHTIITSREYRTVPICELSVNDLLDA